MTNLFERVLTDCVNIPVGIFVWVMIIPMLLKIGFGALHQIRPQIRGIGVTLFINWAVRPFSMVFPGWLFNRQCFQFISTLAVHGKRYTGFLDTSVAHKIQGVAVCMFKAVSLNPKSTLNISSYFGKIRPLLKSVGVVPWHVYVK